MHLCISIDLDLLFSLNGGGGDTRRQSYKGAYYHGVLDTGDYRHRNKIVGQLAWGLTARPVYTTTVAY